MDLEYVRAPDGTDLAARRWLGGDHVGFILVHGLASNLETWGEVAEALHTAGHPVVAYDQRSHGRSRRADRGHDLETSLDDLDTVMAWSGFDGPVLVGQSWGANLVLAHAALRHGSTAIACIDGGVVDLSSQYPSWEACAEALRPPELSVGLDTVAGWIRSTQPEWSERGVAATLANLVTTDDGIARNRLPLDSHMQLLRAIWDHPPSELHSRILVPALYLLASTGDARWTAAKQAAAGSLNGAAVTWLEGHHDLHVHRPELVATHLQDAGWR